MLERLIKAKSAEFVCSTCNKTSPAGSTAHILIHVEQLPQPPSEIHVGFAPNEEPKRVVVVPRMTPPIKDKRHQGRVLIIDRKECDTCHKHAARSIAVRNCFL